MPVIPALKEGQGAYTGTPVTAIDTRDSRMMGEAVNDLGQALFVLGKDLDKSAKERDAIIAKDAKAAWMSQMNAKKDAFVQTGFDQGDSTGKVSMKRIEDEGRDVADQIRARPEMTDRARAIFTAEINEEYVTKYQPGLMVEAGKISDALSDRMATKLINTTSTFAQENPNDFSQILSESMETLQKNGRYTPAEMTKKMKELKDSAFNGGVEGFRQRKDYEGAKNFVQIYGTEMDPKDRKSLIKELDEQKWQDYTRGRQVDENIREDQERAEKKSSDKMLANYTAQYNAAKSEADREKVLQSAVEARRTGALQEGHFNALMSVKEKFGKVDDSGYVANQILNPMTDGKFPDGKAFSFDEARSRVMNAAVGPTPSISAGTANEWVMKLNQMERSFKSDPLMSTNLREAYKRSEQYGKTGSTLQKALQGLNDDTRDLARINRVKQRLSWAAANGINPLTVVDSYSAGSLGQAPVQAFSGTFMPPGVANDPEKAGKWLLDQKSKGTFKGPQGNKNYLNYLREVKNMKDNQTKVKSAQEFTKGLMNLNIPAAKEKK